jgi:hypothetical protein
MWWLALHFIMMLRYALVKLSQLLRHFLTVSHLLSRPQPAAMPTQRPSSSSGNSSSGSGGALHEHDMSDDEQLSSLSRTPDLLSEHMDDGPHAAVGPPDATSAEERKNRPSLSQPVDVPSETKGAHFSDSQLSSTSSVASDFDDSSAHSSGQSSLVHSPRGSASHSDDWMRPNLAVQSPVYDDSGVPIGAPPAPAHIQQQPQQQQQQQSLLTASQPMDAPIDEYNLVMQHSIWDVLSRLKQGDTQLANALERLRACPLSPGPAQQAMSAGQPTVKPSQPPAQLPALLAAPTAAHPAAKDEPLIQSAGQRPSRVDSLPCSVPFLLTDENDLQKANSFNAVVVRHCILSQPPSTRLLRCKQSEELRRAKLQPDEMLRLVKSLSPGEQVVVLREPHSMRPAVLQCVCGQSVCEYEIACYCTEQPDSSSQLSGGSSVISDSSSPSRPVAPQRDCVWPAVMHPGCSQAKWDAFAVRPFFTDSEALHGVVKPALSAAAAGRACAH